MLLTMGSRLDPYSLVALDIVFQRNPELIHALGEVCWVKGGEGGPEQEVGVKFIVMQAQKWA
jgi:hypothetical protein